MKYMYVFIYFLIQLISFSNKNEKELISDCYSIIFNETKISFGINKDSLQAKLLYKSSFIRETENDEKGFICFSYDANESIYDSIKPDRCQLALYFDDKNYQLKKSDFGIWFDFQNNHSLSKRKRLLKIKKNIHQYIQFFSILKLIKDEFIEMNKTTIIQDNCNKYKIYFEKINSDKYVLNIDISPL